MPPETPESGKEAPQEVKNIYIHVVSNVDIATVITVVMSVAISVASSTYALARRIFKLEQALWGLRREIKEIRDEVRSLSLAVYSYNEALLKVLEGKGVLASTESIALLATLKATIPQAMSKYYTEEVRKRLAELLDRLINNPDSATMDDVLEMERIADLMIKEYGVTGRRELYEYAGKLKSAALLVKVTLVEPKLRGRQPARRAAANS